MAWAERGDANRKAYLKYFKGLKVPKAWKRDVLNVTLDDNSTEGLSETAAAGDSD